MFDLLRSPGSFVQHIKCILLKGVWASESHQPQCSHQPPTAIPPCSHQHGPSLVPEASLPALLSAPGPQSPVFCPCGLPGLDISCKRSQTVGDLVAATCMWHNVFQFIMLWSGSNLHPFLWASSIPLADRPTRSTCLSADGHLSCSHFSCCNKAAGNVRVALASLSPVPGSRAAGPRGTSVFDLLRSPRLLAPLYLPTSSGRRSAILVFSCLVIFWTSESLSTVGFLLLFGW